MIAEEGGDVDDFLFSVVPDVCGLEFLGLVSRILSAELFLIFT